MKKTLLCFVVLLFSATPAFAAPEIPDGYPPDLASLEGGKIAAGNAGKAPLSEIDYMNPVVVPLNDKEKRALQLSRDWSRKNVDPVLSGGGKVVYVHGASLPTIIATPMQVCDVELEQGEMVNEIVVGDSARWMVDSGTAGSGPGVTVHLFIKPVDSVLESSEVVTTDRRVYHLRLVSQRAGHTPYVGFLYSDDLRRNTALKQARAYKETVRKYTSKDGKRTDMTPKTFI